ncbi:MAG: flagellar hook basal-body protein [Rickettsiaceae bacterium]
MNKEISCIKNCLLFFTLLLFSDSIYANNASYIALSNYVSKQYQLQIIANNVANSNTIGYESDRPVFNTVSLNGSNSVQVLGAYKSNEQGTIKFTNNPLHLAIDDKNAYFKILTSRGERYTLDGMIFINKDNMLVNSAGEYFSNRDSTAITLPNTLQQDSLHVTILDDGTVYVGEDQVDQLGIFYIANRNLLSKEGNNLYISSVDGILLDELKLNVGALRMSDVKNTNEMMNVMESQQASEKSTNLMNAIAGINSTVIKNMTN